MNYTSCLADVNCWLCDFRGHGSLATLEPLNPYIRGDQLHTDRRWADVGALSRSGIFNKTVVKIRQLQEFLIIGGLILLCE